MNDQHSIVEVDILVINGFVLTMDEGMTVFYPGAMAVSGNSIVDVGPADELTGRYSAWRTLDASGHVVMPGLINAHTHLGMGYLRGMADGLKLFDWMIKVTRPTKPFAGEADNYALSLLGCIESIMGGVTTIVDSNDHFSATVAAVDRSGIRGLVSPYIIDNNDTALTETLLLKHEAFYEQYHGTAGGRVQVMFTVHTPYSCSTKLLQGVKALAERYDGDIQIHLAESRDEESLIQQRYGVSPTRYCADIGFLGPEVLAAHFVWASGEDIRIATEHGVRIAHNPVSNLKLASGISPLPQLREAGLVIGLGTDSCVSNNRLDLFETMKLTAMLHNGLVFDPLAISAEQALRMATSEGARAVGISDVTGSLEIGKRADFILVRFADTVHLTPHFFGVPSNIVSHLVFAAQPSDVRLVAIDGQIVMEERVMCNLDEMEVIRIAQASSQRVLHKAGRI